jgi:hypothetical protein
MAEDLDNQLTVQGFKVQVPLGGYGQRNALKGIVLRFAKPSDSGFDRRQKPDKAGTQTSSEDRLSASPLQSLGWWVVFYVTT